MKLSVPLIILTFAFVCLGRGEISAQTTFGVRVSSNSTKYSMITHLGKLFRPRGVRVLGVGANVDIEINDHLSFLPEIGLSARGFEANILRKVGDDWVQMEAWQKIKVVEVPLLFKVGNQRNGWSYYALAGPNIAYSLSGSVTTEETVRGALYTIKERVDLKQLPYDRFEACLTLGGGLSLELPGGKIVADMRYNMGLTTLSTDQNDEQVPYGIRSRTIGLNLGYQFYLR